MINHRLLRNIYRFIVLLNIALKSTDELTFKTIDTRLGYGRINFFLKSKIHIIFIKQNESRKSRHPIAISLNYLPIERDDLILYAAWGLVVFANNTGG